MAIELLAAVESIDSFVRKNLTHRIAEIESELRNVEREEFQRYLSTNGIDSDLLASTYVVKKIAAEINVLVHAIGILVALPQLLEPGEEIIELSLGAGNTGKPFDLETTERVAEFKFINWQGGPEVIRQNALFKDFYLLAEHPTGKRKYLYVTGIDHPLRFLKGGRALRSVMSRHSRLWADFGNRYGDRFTRVRDYYGYRRESVQLQDISPLLPTALA